MSFITLFTAGLAAFAPLASAYTQPKGDPSGNAIYEPGLNSIVPVGKPFSITWEPTTEGKISLVLLHGPSTNVVPIATIAESIDNSGSYSWTPSTSLAPNNTYYGIELIVEGTGQFQYSTQFGISNPDYSSSSSASSSASFTTTPSVNIKGPMASETASGTGASASLASASLASASSSAHSKASSASAAGTGTAAMAMSAASTSAANASSTGSSAASNLSSSASSAAGHLSTSTKSGSSSASRTGSATSSGSAAAQTGAAVKVGAGFGSLALAAGVVALVL